MHTPATKANLLKTRYFSLTHMTVDISSYDTLHFSYLLVFFLQVYKCVMYI